MAALDERRERLIPLLTMCELGDAARKLTNAELARILIDHVWSELPIDSPASALISEIACRLDPTLDID